MSVGTRACTFACTYVVPSRLRQRLGFHPSPAFRKRLSCPVGRPKRSRTALLLLRTGLAQGSPSRARVTAHLRARPHEASRLGRSQQRRLGKRGVPCVPGTRFSSESGVSRGPACWGRWAGGSSSFYCARRGEAYLRFAGTRRRRRARRRRRRRDVKLLGRIT